jgi:hypothetical protein
MRLFAAAVLLLTASSLAMAQSPPVVETGGCGAGSFPQGAGYFTVDSAGRNCGASSPASLGWYSYSNITGQATTTIKTGTGVLHSITFNTPAATETLTLYDNTTGSGTKIGTLTVPSSPVPVTLVYDVQFATGLTIVTAVASGDITVTYK